MNLINTSNRCLLVAAAPKEVRAVCAAFDQVGSESVAGSVTALDDRFDLVHCGVGKASAAAATARALAVGQYNSMISVGIAGSLPTGQSTGQPAGQSYGQPIITHQLQITQSLTATRSCFADEGVGTGDGYIPMSDLGFAPFANGTMGIDHDPDLVSALASITDATGIIATVSWCSGDDGCAQGVARRTGAAAEAMEGAACAVAAQMINPDIRTSELRIISNTTGDRSKQEWDLGGALDKLTSVLGRLR
ncbi:MAG: hypothetical protein AB8C13_03320 [Phycisphaerales bacterium]